MLAQWGSPASDSGAPIIQILSSTVPVSDPSCKVVYLFENHWQEWLIFDNSGKFLSFNRDGTLLTTYTFALDPKGFLYATDYYNGGVVKYDSSGNALTKFGSFGYGEGELRPKTFGIGIDARGDVYVGDTGNNRTEVFSYEGGYLGQSNLLGLLPNPSGTLVYGAVKQGVIEVRAGFGYFLLQYAAGAGGSVSGTTEQKVGWARDGKAVTALPCAGYHFVSWSDGVAGAVRTDLKLTADLSVQANFAPDANYTLRYEAGFGGAVRGATLQRVAAGGSGTQVTALAHPGYHFDCWSDGSTSAARTDTNVGSNQCLTAKFISNTTYTLKFQAGAGGTINGATSQYLYQGGRSSAVEAVPNDGYHFVDWTGNKGFQTTAGNPLVVKGVVASQSITANFAIDKYRVSLLAGPHGRIVGDRNQTVCHGGSTTPVTAVPDPGYRFVSWTDADNKVLGTSATLKFPNLTSVQSIAANFIRR